MADKTRILMYWGYHRKAWTKPFEELSDEFEFIYIFHFDKTSEIEHRSDLNVRYFSEFRNISHLLDSLDPKKIVFIGLDGILSLMINYHARKSGIESLVIQHGFLYKLSDQLREYKQERRGQTPRNISSEMDASVQSDKKYDKSFLLKSIDTRNLWFFLRLIFNRFQYKGKSDHEKVMGLKSECRLANRYLLHAPYFAKLYVERDKVKNRITFFGNPEADIVLHEAKSTTSKTHLPYLLHIDQPVIHAYKQGHQAKYSLEEGREFYQRLNQLAKKKGMRLWIKLHPYSFHFLELYPDEPNITYIKEIDSLGELIGRATLVTGFYSTLILSALVLKPTLLFELTEGNEFFDDLKSIYKVHVLPFNSSLRLLESTVDSIVKNDSHEFISDFFYSTDGLSLTRLKAALQK